jgi:hypothetical protein
MGINFGVSDWEKNTKGVWGQDAEENICGYEGGFVIFCFCRILLGRSNEGERDRWGM